MENLQRKTNRDELRPPTFSARMKNLNGGPDIEIVFNQSKDSFDYDVIYIKSIPGKENCKCRNCTQGIHLVRDDLASVIQQGYQRTERYVEDELLK